MAEQRRLAAIMFTDVVGYSAMVQKNEASALELLEEHKAIVRSILPAYRGSEVKTIGDAFLVEFASALDAARCAIEIQRSLHDRNLTVVLERRIRLRIGLHVGDIVSKENDVYGDGVNITSRIEPIAEPGGICISQQVFDQIRNKIEEPLARLGTGELKNIEVPIAIYKVILPWEKKHLRISDQVAFYLRQKKTQLFVAAILVVLVFAGLWFARPGSQQQSIAVLPFQSFGGNDEDEYFVDGMTESLITDLANLPGLLVIARNSVFQYKERRKEGGIDVQKVGKELNVRYVLEGSIQRAGDKLRVNVQLIDVMNGFHVWAEKFDRELKDLFAVQDDISMHIIEALKMTLNVPDEQKFKTQRASNLEANDLYWKGLYYSRRRTKPDNDRALEYFRSALERDPTFAAAHAALASALRFRYAFGFERLPEVLEEAKAHSENALSLDPKSSEALLVKGLIQREDGDLVTAIRTLQRALDANPRNADALYYLGNAWRDAGDFQKAIDYHERSMELDPQYFFNPYNLFVDYWFCGQYAKAIDAGNKAIALNPEHFLSYLIRCLNYTHAGNEKEAVALATKLIELEPNHLDSYAERAIIYTNFGRFEEALNDVRFLYEHDPQSQTLIGAAMPLYVNLNKYHEASALLSKGLQRKGLLLVQGIDFRSTMLLARAILQRLQGEESRSHESLLAARRSIEETLAKFPESSSFIDLHGLILAHLGEFDKSIPEMETALKIMPGTSQYAFDFACVYALKGDKTKAFEWVRRAVELGKTDYEMMRIEFCFRNFAHDPAFLEILRRPAQKVAGTP